MTHKVELDRRGCIGAGACAAVAPEYWEMKPDGKPDLIGGAQKENEFQEKEFPDKDLDLVMESAKVCPVNVIIIWRDGTKLWPETK
jgi:ferredoxin